LNRNRGKMSKRSQYDLLSLSVLIVSLGVGLALVSVGYIGLLDVLPVVVSVMGVWLIILSAIQGKNFSIFSWGLLLVAGGTMGFLYIRNIFTGFFIPVILIVLGLIGVIAVLRSKKGAQ